MIDIKVIDYSDWTTYHKVKTDNITTENRE